MNFKFQIKVIVTLLLLFTGTITLAQQQLAINGQLKERGANRALPSGGLLLTGAKDTVRVVSDASGAFSFHHLKPDKYRLIGTYVGYMPDTLVLQLKKDTALVVLLKSAPRLLAEVKVRAKQNAVTIRNDTIAFNTQAYPTPPNATVADLLRRLPGMRVDASGNVTFRGRKVDKVLINGRIFFINDLTKVMHNLPADIVSQVEMFDSQSDENKLANISEMSDTKTINLKLKKNKSNGWLGKSYADYGTGKRYVAGGDITHLDSINMFTASGLVNNIGGAFSGTGDDAPTTTGQNQLGNMNLNYQRVMSKKLTANIFADGDFNNHMEKATDLKTTYLGDSILRSKQASSSSERSHDFEIGGHMTYKIDDFTSLTTTINYAQHPGNSDNLNTTMAEVEKMQQTDTSSTGLAKNTSSQQGYFLSSQWALTHRFAKEHRALIFSLLTAITDFHQQEGVYTRVLTHNPADTAIVNQQSQNSGPTNNYGASLTYNEPVGKNNNISMGYSWSIANNGSSKKSNDYNIADGQYDIPDTITSSHFEAKRISQSFKFTFDNNPGPKLHYEFIMGIGSALQENKDMNLGTLLKRHDFTLVPTARLSYALEPGKDIHFDYVGFNELPFFFQLQPVPDVTNPYLVRVGNPGLVPSFTHSLQAKYVDFNSKNSHDFELGMTSDITENPMSEATDILPGGVQRVEYVNTAPDYKLTGEVRYGLPFFGQDHGNADFGTHFNYGHAESIVNGLNNTDVSQGTGTDCEISYNEKDKFFADATIAFDYVNNMYSLPGQIASQSWQQHYMVNLTWVLPLGLSVKAHYDRRVINSGGFASQRSDFLNASLAKNVFGNHGCQVQVSGYNLLNAKSAISQTTGPDFIEVSQGAAVQPLVLLSFVYHFENLNAGGAH